MYKGRKSPLEDGTIKVDLMSGSKVIHSHISKNDVYANAYIIPWVAQQGYTDLTITSDNHVVDWDNFDEVYLYQD